MKRILIILLLAVVAFPAFAQMGSNSHTLADLLTTAAESEENTPKRAESGLQGWIDCYEKSALKAHLFCGGVNDAREISGNSKLQDAFERGKNV